MDRLIHNADGSFSVVLRSGQRLELQLGALTSVPNWLRSCPLSADCLVLYAVQIRPSATKSSSYEAKKEAYGYASWTFCHLGHLSCYSLCHILTSEPLLALSAKLDQIPVAVSTPSRDLSLIVDLIRQSGFRRIRLPLTFLLLVPDSYEERFCKQLVEQCSQNLQRWELTGEQSQPESENGDGLQELTQ